MDTKFNFSERQYFKKAATCQSVALQVEHSPSKTGRARHEQLSAPLWLRLCLAAFIGLICVKV
jgi:hypothetical protein